MFLFMAVSLGLLVIGQTVSWLSRVGAIKFHRQHHGDRGGARTRAAAGGVAGGGARGTANVVELGTARALGEVEALEAWH